MANAVANLIKRARRARRGSHSYAIPVPPRARKAWATRRVHPQRTKRAVIASVRHCMARRPSYLFRRWSTENPAVKNVVINIASDDVVEILSPTRSPSHRRCSVVCLCCERADQPMDDDGCGICDVCLGLPVGATSDLGGLELPTPSPYFMVTARNR